MTNSISTSNPRVVAVCISGGGVPNPKTAENVTSDPIIRRKKSMKIQNTESHWHGMFEVAERFYQKLIPQAREIAHQAEEGGDKSAGDAVRAVVNELLSHPEHQWYEEQKGK